MVRYFLMLIPSESVPRGEPFERSIDVRAISWRARCLIRKATMVDKQMVLFVLVEVARLREINVTLYDTCARSFPIRDIIQLREIGNSKSPFGRWIKRRDRFPGMLKTWTLAGVTEEGCSSLASCCNRRRCRGDRAGPRNRYPRNGCNVNRAISADGPDEYCNRKVYYTSYKNNANT